MALAQKISVKKVPNDNSPNLNFIVLTTYPFDEWFFLTHQLYKTTLGHGYLNSKDNVLNQICAMSYCGFDHHCSGQ